MNLTLICEKTCSFQGKVYLEKAYSSEKEYTILRA